MSRIKVDVDLTKSKFDSGVEGMKSSLEGIKGLIEGFAVVEAFKDLTAKAFDYADSIDKASLKMHIGTDEVQALSFAAREAGTSLEKIQSAYEKIQLAKSKALSGDAEATKSLKDLGVSAGDIHDPNSTLKMFGTIASSASHGGEREQVAMQRMGLRETAGDLTALGDSVKDLDGKVKELKSQGQIISEEDIDKLVEAKDEFEALENQAIVMLAPAITGAIEAILHGIISLEDLFKGLFSSISQMAEDTKKYIENLSKHGKENAEIIAKNTMSRGGAAGFAIAGIPGLIAGAVLTAKTKGNDQTLGSILGKDASTGLNSAIDNYQKDSDALDNRIAAFIAQRKQQRQGDGNASPIDATPKNTLKPILYADELTKSGNMLGASFGQAGMAATALDLQKQQVDKLEDIHNAIKDQTKVFDKIMDKPTALNNWEQDFQYS